jgi:hypothetical protein
MLTQKLMGAGGAGGELTLALTASATANLTRASLPAVSAGDLIIVMESANTTAATQVTPSGWTSLFWAANAAGSAVLFVHCVLKVSDGTETGTIAATSDATPGGYIVNVFSGGISGFTIVDLDFFVDKNAPPPQVKNASTLSTSPQLIWAMVGAAENTTNAPLLSPTRDGSTTTIDDDFHTAWLFFGESDTASDVTVSWPSIADRMQIMASTIIEVT